APRPGPAPALCSEEARSLRAGDGPGRGRDAALARLARLLLHRRRSRPRLGRGATRARLVAVADGRVELAACARDRRAARSAGHRARPRQLSRRAQPCGAARRSWRRGRGRALARARRRPARRGGAGGAGRLRPPPNWPAERRHFRPSPAARPPNLDSMTLPGRRSPAAPAARAMTIALPVPQRPGNSREQVRAHRRWQAGQALARREQWPLAAREFEQASGLHGDRAYALAAVHALIKAGRSAPAAERARAVREADPSVALAYTLESHALLSLGRAATAVDCLRSMPAAVPRDHDHHVSLAVALQRTKRHE